ncbi:MAG: hypothetical protein ACC742_04245 [Thermoanaerobaculales bacterium]
MRRMLFVMFAVVVFALSIGCGAQPAEETEDVVAAPIAEQPAPSAEEATTLEMVEVAAEGAEFDPPVLAEQLPDGAWYCGMDTVHYARMDEGDGKCGVCGMNLTQKEAAEESVPG